MDADVIAELTQAVQNLEAHGTRPGEGIMIEARQRANRLKFMGRPLFDSSARDLTVLLAALFVACRKDHELLELIRRHQPEELDQLIRESADAETHALSERPSRQSTPTPKQRQELKRRIWNRAFTRSIEYQFGGRLEADDWRKFLSPLLGRTAYKNMLLRSQTCLDDIFTGETVNILRLEELFWMDRRRFAEPLRSFQKRPLNYLAVTKIMDFLLEKKRRTKSNRSKPGPSPRLPWLDQKALRMRVLKAIEARINSLPVGRKLATAFLTVIHAHLPRSGKK
jgi:hypothetical protein